MKSSSGNISAAIWANESEKHNLWFNVKVSRSYKQNGQWKDTSSFGCDDLPVVCKAIDMAYGWILRHEQELKQEQRDSIKDEE